MSRTRMNRLAVFVLAIACLLARGVAFAQSSSPQSDAKIDQPPPEQNISDQDIQMLRQNLRSQRRRVIAANMQLTPAEAAKFWPIYDQYIAELVKLNGAKYEIIKQDVQSNGVLTDAQADSAVKKWISVDQGVSDLRLRYVPTFRKVLSAQNTALFYQLDRRVQLMIDLQLVSVLPLITPTH